MSDSLLAKVEQLHSKIFDVSINPSIVFSTQLKTDLINIFLLLCTSSNTRVDFLE